MKLSTLRIAMLLSLLLAVVAPAAGMVGVEHVIVIGCDGMGSLSFTDDNAPVMHRLMREGAWTLRARGVMPTSSSPNWASMIMGAGPEQHGVTSNDWETNKFEIPALEVGPEGMFPTIFRVLREQRPTSSIACVHDWDGFSRLFERHSADLVENVKGSTNTARRAIEAIRERQPTFTFVHFDDVDHAGHGHKWKSPEYFQAVEEVDGLIGEIIAAAESTPMRGRTLVLVTADHGGAGTKHGGPTIGELEIPWIIWGPGVAAGKEIKTPVNTYDTAATLAHVFGLKPPAVWIGRPVLSAFRPQP
jgi:predicted AlkP superfamily pyrophosphatase or phosphodiesterase